MYLCVESIISTIKAINRMSTFVTEKHRNCRAEGDNPIGELFNRFPMLNLSQIAKDMGINPSLMQQYVNGRKKPTFERAMEIERYIRALGEELTNIRIK